MMNHNSLDPHLSSILFHKKRFNYSAKLFITVKQRFPRNAFDIFPKQVMRVRISQQSLLIFWNVLVILRCSLGHYWLSFSQNFGQNVRISRDCWECRFYFRSKTSQRTTVTNIKIETDAFYREFPQKSNQTFTLFKVCFFVQPEINQRSSDLIAKTI